MTYHLLQPICLPVIQAISSVVRLQQRRYHRVCFTGEYCRRTRYFHHQGCFLCRLAVQSVVKTDDNWLLKSSAICARSIPVASQWLWIWLYICQKQKKIFTARCYASTVLAMGLCLRLCLSQVRVLLKRLNVGSHKQHHTISQGL